MFLFIMITLPPPKLRLHRVGDPTEVAIPFARSPRLWNLAGFWKMRPELAFPSFGDAPDDQTAQV